MNDVAAYFRSTSDCQEIASVFQKQVMTWLYEFVVVWFLGVYLVVRRLMAVLCSCWIEMRWCSS